MFICVGTLINVCVTKLPVSEGYHGLCFANGIHLVFIFICCFCVSLSLHGVTLISSMLYGNVNACIIDI